MPGKKAVVVEDVEVDEEKVEVQNARVVKVLSRTGSTGGVTQVCIC
jgi:ribosomal protein S28E/S33